MKWISVKEKVPLPKWTDWTMVFVEWCKDDIEESWLEPAMLNCGRWISLDGHPIDGPLFRVTKYLIPTKPRPSPGRASKKGKPMKGKSKPGKAAKKPPMKK